MILLVSWSWRWCRCWAVFALLNAVLASGARAAPDFPPLTGRIVDQARLLSSADRAQIETTLAALERKVAGQVVVVTLKSLQGYSIDDYGFQLARHWQIGQSAGGNSVLMIIAAKDRMVRIEVARGSQPHLSDALSKLIIDNAVLPAFRRGDFSGGIKSGARDIKDVLLGDTALVEQRAASLLPRSVERRGPAALLSLAAFLIVAAFTLWQQHVPVQAAPVPGGGNIGASWSGVSSWGAGSGGSGGGEGGASGGW